MLMYTRILFVLAFAFAAIGLEIYRGRVELIHDYHRAKVKDKKGYGKAFAKAFWSLPVTFVLSGIISLLGEQAVFLWVSVGVLVLGIVVGIRAIVKVQMQFNGGVF